MKQSRSHCGSTSTQFWFTRFLVLWSM